MKELKFPVIKGKTCEPKVLSMDEYHEFVQFNLKYAFDRKTYEKWKKLLAVDVPFRLE